VALVKCPDCGKMISGMAPACIGCGRPKGSPVQPVAASHAEPPRRSPVATAPANPAAPETSQYYVRGSGNKVHGPYSLEALKRQFKKGHFTSSNFIRKDDSKEFEEPSRFLGDWTNIRYIVQGSIGAQTLEELRQGVSKGKHKYADRVRPEGTSAEWVELYILLGINEPPADLAKRGAEFCVSCKTNPCECDKVTPERLGIKPPSSQPPLLKEPVPLRNQPPAASNAFQAYDGAQSGTSSPQQEGKSFKAKDHGTRELYEAIIGEKNRVYYLAKFERFDLQGDRWKAGWNWPAFFFTGFWALYRKMYGLFFAFWGIAFLSNLLVKSGAEGVGLLILLVSTVGFGIYANSLYHKKIKKKVAHAQSTVKHDLLLESLRYGGGVNTWVMWVGYSLPVVGIIAAILIPMLLTAGK